MAKKTEKSVFHSAEDEVKASSSAIQTLQTSSPSYRLAFTDTDFLLRRSLRSVRLQLELLKPETLQQDLGIISTIVVFGSARIPAPDEADAKLAVAQAALDKDPSDSECQRLFKHAQSEKRMSAYYGEAREFARLVSKAAENKEIEDVIVTGGGPGIMEAANRGAHDVNAKSIGLTVVLPNEAVPNRFITPELSFRFHYFAIRKMHFLMRARALVIFPGGYGTMDELFEALTLIQTQKIEPMPVILVGRAFWDRVVNFQALVDDGMISPEDVNLFRYVETGREAWEKIKAFYAQQTQK